MGAYDVYGKVTLTGSFTTDQTYSFGQPDTRITFTGNSTLPRSVSLTTTRGPALGLVGSIKAWYRLEATGCSGCIFTIRIHYGDSVLGGLCKDTLKFYRRASGSAGPWSIVDSANFVPEWNTVEVEGQTTWNDWALGSNFAMYLPMMIK